MTTPQPGSLLTPLSVFRRRSFTLLWLAQFISTFGTGLTQVAAGILVYRATGSALQVGLLLAATALPGLGIGLLAGVVVDRGDRRRLMVAADVMRAILIALLPTLLPIGTWTIYVIVALMSAANQFFDPAHESVIAELAPNEELGAASSLMQISVTGATTLGYAAAGLLAAVAVEWAFYLDALTFLVSALLVSLVPIGRALPDTPARLASIAVDLRAGLGLIVGTPTLRSLLLLFGVVFVVFGMENALLLPFAVQALGASELEYSLFESAMTIGFVIGCVLMASRADRLPAGRWITLSLAGMGLSMLVYSHLGSMAAVLVVGGLSSFCNAPSYIGRKLLLTRATPPEARGRVFATFFVARDGLFLLGMLAAGLADLVDVRLLVTGLGITLLGCGLGSLLLPGLGVRQGLWRTSLAHLRAVSMSIAEGEG